MNQTINMAKKACVLAIVPVCVGLLSFLLFDFIQSSYTAEARLLAHFRTSETEPSPQLLPSLPSKQSPNKMNSLLASMQSERSIQLMAISMAVHDLTTDEPFSPRKQAIESLRREERAILAAAFQEKLARLDLEFGPSQEDSVMKRMLRRLGYTIVSLSDKLSISTIPGTNQIRIQGHGYTPEMSTFIVNRFCAEFMRYHTTVERERLESSIALLEHLTSQKRAELGEKTALLREERKSLREDRADAQTQDILRKIGKLQSTVREEEKRIEALKARLENRKNKRSATRVVAVRLVWPTQSDNEHELAIQLGSAMAHLKYIKQELDSLHLQLSQREAALLAAYEEEVIQAEHAYISVLDKLKDAEYAKTQVDQSLEIVSKGTSRFPNPLASRFLAGLAGLTSFFLWAIWLFQVKYLKWTSFSARNLPNPSYPTDHQL